MVAHNADPLLRGSAFAFAGMGRCRLSPSPIAALRGPCPFSVSPTRCQLPAASCFPAVGYRPIWKARAWTPPCTHPAPIR